MDVLLAVRWSIKAWREEITDTTIANCWLKSKVLGPQMTPMTRWQAERGGWQEAVDEDERKLTTTIQQMKAIIQTFEDDHRIEKAMDIHQFINPEAEQVKESMDEANLVEEIAASYSLAPEPEDTLACLDNDLDPIIQIRPAQALAAIQTLREWEEQQDDGTHEVVRQLQALEKRAKRVQSKGLQQRTLASYFA